MRGSVRMRPRSRGKRTGGSVPGPAVGTTWLSGHRFSLTQLTVITVNMHKARSRLSELVKAVEEGNETVILQRHGTPVAELRRYRPAHQRKFDRLKTHPELRVTFGTGYQPTEPLQPDEVADWMRSP
jgi:prevent-host-death family protein